jgi:LysR family transcriptional activator of dmlA
VHKSYAAGPLDLNDVRTFATIADVSTFSAAAKAVGVPVSTITRSITRLEAHLGMTLLQRSPRGFRLTEVGKEYLQACRKALRALAVGGELVESQHLKPSGVIRVGCPVTMAREVVAPLAKEFLERFPDLRLEIEPYASDWDQEPPDDVDIFFKLRAPRDSERRVRAYPGNARGVFASSAYIREGGQPSEPGDLIKHKCIGSGIWNLCRGKTTVTPDVTFQVITSDPQIHLITTLQGMGISILPLWMAEAPGVRRKLVSILGDWKPEPITMHALFVGQARRTPKVQAFLDFLGEFLGTDRDPRLQHNSTKELFTPLSLAPTSGP